MNWKEKLEDEENLLLLGINDKHSAWQKLSSRLQTVKTKRLPLWSWATAATILLMLSLILLVQQNPPGKTVLAPTPTNTLPVEETKHILSMKPVADSTYTSLPTSKLEALPKHKTGNPITLNEPITIREEIIAPSGDPENEHQTVNMQMPGNENLSATEAIAAAAPPKKMKLVHINELAESPSNLRIHSPAEDFGVIKIRLNKKQVLTGSQPASASRSQVHLKTKNNSSN